MGVVTLQMCADDPSTGASMVAKARADCSLALQQDPTYALHPFPCVQMYMYM